MLLGQLANVNKIQQDAVKSYLFGTGRGLCSRGKYIVELFGRCPLPDGKRKIS